MAECAFTSAAYTPEATKLAEDLTIVALVPTFVPVVPSQPGSEESGDGISDDSGDSSDSYTEDGLGSSAATLHHDGLKYPLYLLAPLTVVFLYL